MGRCVVEFLRLESGGAGNGPEGGGAGRIGSVRGLKLPLSLGWLGRPLLGLKFSPSRGRAVGGADTLLEVRGGKTCRSKVALGDGCMPVPLTSFEGMRWAAVCSTWETGFLSSSTIGIMPEVGVLVTVEAEAGVSFGDGIDSPRSRASVAGESCGARCDLRL